VTICAVAETLHNVHSKEVLVWIANVSAPAIPFKPTAALNTADMEPPYAVKLAVAGTTSSNHDKNSTMADPACTKVVLEVVLLPEAAFAATKRFGLRL
jgi:hypothetical protein